MKTMPNQILGIVAATAILTGAALPIGAIPGQADDEVDMYCWRTVDGVVCEPVADLKAECAVTDPDNENEVCADVSQLYVKGMGLTATSAPHSIGTLAGDSHTGHPPEPVHPALPRPAMNLRTAVGR